MADKDKLKIEEEKIRFQEFLDILLEADLRTIKRLNDEHKQEQVDSNKS